MISECPMYVVYDARIKHAYGPFNRREDALAWAWMAEDSAYEREGDEYALEIVTLS